MVQRLKIGLWSLCILDALLGLFLVFWPGAWHELTYPSATRTTFYLIQQLGFVLLARSLITGLLSRRSDGGRFVFVGYLWAMEVPAHGYALWALTDWSHYGTEISALRLALCIVVWAMLRRRNH